jgi:butyryl-CoA dehydrogenase
MDFELTEDQSLLLSAVREFAEEVVRPGAARIDQTGEFPRDVFAEAGKLGLAGVAVPVEHGGSGMDNVAYSIVIEEISRVCANTGVILSVNNSLVCDPIEKFGNDDQKRRFLVPLARGEKLGCFALTEPDAGSDAGALRTEARETVGGFTLHGTKTWITNGGFADRFVIFARSENGVCALVADRGEGLDSSSDLPKLGLHTSSTVELRLDGLRVPSENLLGAEGDGLRIALATLDGGRVTIAAQACGIARAALELAVRYAGERHAFGGPIGRFQGVQFPIADIAARLDGAWLLTLRAAALRDAKQPHTQEGARAKLVASRVAVDAADMAVQTLGGYGYSAEFPAERYYRDAKITELYEGTSQIQRLVIARGLLGSSAR